MTVPVECQPVQEVIDSFVQERDRLQEELEQADPAIRPFILEQIRRANQAIAIQTEKLIECITGPPLFATFIGSATITTTNPVAPGPFSSPIELGLKFNNPRTTIAIRSFPAILSPEFDTPFGKNITTITKTGGGGGSYGLGTIVLPITLLFDHSVEPPILGVDSTLAVTLVTSPPGSPVNSQGNVSMVGSNVFVGGILEGFMCNLTVTGTISPVP